MHPCWIQLLISFKGIIQTPNFWMVYHSHVISSLILITNLYNTVIELWGLMKRWREEDHTSGNVGIKMSKGKKRKRTARSEKRDRLLWNIWPARLTWVYSFIHTRVIKTSYKSHRLRDSQMPDGRRPSHTEPPVPVRSDIRKLWRLCVFICFMRGFFRPLTERNLTCLVFSLKYITCHFFVIICEIY